MMYNILVIAVCATLFVVFALAGVGIVCIASGHYHPPRQ